MRSRDDSHDWMWSDALAALDRVERLHHQLFQPQQARTPTWAPPVDVLETARELLIYVALPGVDACNVKTVIDDGVLVVSGQRVLPPPLRTATIHRLELPQGHFERRVPLPPGVYSRVDASNEHGCLVIRLEKAP